MGKEKKNPIGVIGGQRIRHKGLFDFNGLMKGIPDWLTQHGYDIFQKGHSQKQTGSGGYLEANWEAFKETTEYVMFKVKVDIWLRDLNDVAVERNGKTVKMNKGNIEITFNSEMVKDYNKIFATKDGEIKPFHKFIKEVYEKHVVKARLSALEDKLLIETQALMDHIRTFLRH
ncbi:MAG: hypothetical protein V1906_02685 [Candidatus Woesearchaeota archaeon]